MYDIVFVGKNNNEWNTLKKKFPLIKQADTFENAVKKTFTKMFWVVWDDLIIDPNFNFDYVVPVWDEKYTHVFRNGCQFD